MPQNKRMNEMMGKTLLCPISGESRTRVHVCKRVYNPEAHPLNLFWGAIRCMIPHPHNHPATFTSTERATEKEATAQATSGIRTGNVWHSHRQRLKLAQATSGIRTGNVRHSHRQRLALAQATSDTRTGNVWHSHRQRLALAQATSDTRTGNVWHLQTRSGLGACTARCTADGCRCQWGENTSEWSRQLQRRS